MHFEVTKLAVDGNVHKGYATDCKTPVFSWAAEHSQDCRSQAAYRITVKSENGIKWDTGWTLSDAQSVEYKGESFFTGEELFWSVTLRDDMGNESKTGESSFFAAYMEPWKAPWITTPWDEDRVTKYFSKAFCIERAIKKAWLYICGIGYQYITVNGKSVDSAYLQPAVSDYEKECYYISLPVGDFLNTGDNIIEAAVGDGWRRNNGEYLNTFDRNIVFLMGTPKLTGELIIEYENGEKVRIPTDESWMCGKGPITENNIFDGETYDERIKAEYTDNAVVCSGNAIMRAQTIPPIAAYNRRKPVAKNHVKGGYVFDFGVNMAGVVEVKIPADMPEGTVVKIHHAENILPDGSLDKETLRRAKVIDTFICSGKDGERIWYPKFTYHGFRYIFVEGWHCIPDKESFTAVAFCTDVENESFFRCGNTLVNTIQSMILQTEKNNIHSIATDCPQRDERLGWLNDATVRFEEMPYNFNVRGLFSKIVDDIATDQGEDGAITCTAPSVWGFRPADPVCSSYLVAAWENFLHYGDKKTIARHYRDFKAWNECIKSKRVDGIVEYSRWGDWAGPADCCKSMEDAHSALTSGILMSTGYHYFNYKLLEKFAEILENESEAELNRKEAELVRSAFLNKWWDGETGIVDNGSQGSQTFALWLGILPEEKRHLAAEKLHEAVEKSGYRLQTGNLNSKYIMDVLTEYGYVEDAWKIITREEYPSWGYMIQNGATTIWERFEFKRGSGMNSHDHPMYGAVGYWFYAYLAGVKPGEKEGWKEFTVKPYMPADLKFAECGIDTPYGMVYVKWQKQMGQTDLLINVPFGTTAKISLPWGEEAEVGYGCHSFSRKGE